MTILRPDFSRRHLLGLGVAAGGGLLLPRLVRADSLPSLTPSCTDGDEPTPAQTEGPYFTPNSPERTNLVAEGIEGDRITLTGFALDRQCRPIPHALLDLWHCDSEGRYDNQGYRLRGHQFTDAQGRFAFETIVPALYPGRTRHFHVKVQAPGGDILTTQLYFPGEPGNERDRIFNAALLMDVTPADGGKIGRYDFVLG
ncbi:MAG TPA: intradiol ring-cleavage dioxygenase [Dongiaceae bacterium]|nr:intradiol ring-cleavage dioxygenase [Dongiaceae bacterium]